MFKEVPLVQIETKDVNLKIPIISSDDINKYIDYLTLRVQKNLAILEDRTLVINRMLARCGTTDHAEARSTITILNQLGPIVGQTEDINTRINTQIENMNTILESGIVTGKQIGRAHV